MIFYCKELSEKIREEIKEEVSKLETKPNLTVIRVGDDLASQTYVRNKVKACQQVGIESSVIELPEDIDQSELARIIEILNNNNLVTGILVQLPLPEHINERFICNLISPKKDVDCFHPYNVGRIYNENGVLRPCTPAGVISVLQHSKTSISGADVVIIGRSAIVGKPLATLLTNLGATVTICNSKTKDLKTKTRNADIVISAIGRPKFFGKEYFTSNTVVIDVGINRDENNKLCGDVNFEEVSPFVDLITPVPGGIGVMTVTFLLYNTLQCYLYQN